jgi:hypothetical protein
MSDYPRIQLNRGDNDDQHLHYHGAPIVSLVFRLADRWAALPRRTMARHSSIAGPVVEHANPWTQAAALAAAALVLFGAVPADAQDTVRIRGTIEAVTGDIYSIRTRDDKSLRLRLAANANVAASVRSAITDIKPGIYIGMAAVPEADGSLRALEAHIFDESMRGAAEGHRAWDILPKSTMTNAVVDDVVRTVDGDAITLKYKDGQQRILVPTGTTVVSYRPGSTAELKVGAVVFVPSATSQTDGTFEAQRVMVGRDVAPPQ